MIQAVNDQNKSDLQNRLSSSSYPTVRALLMYQTRNSRAFKEDVERALRRYALHINLKLLFTLLYLFYVDLMERRQFFTLGNL